MHPLQTPPLVERVVEGDQYAVALTVDPRDLLPRLLDALAQSHVRASQYLLALRGNTPERRRELIRAIAADPLVRDACVLQIAPGDAEELIGPIDDAVTEPALCLAHDCTNYETSRNGYCANHVERHLRAV